MLTNTSVVDKCKAAIRGPEWRKARQEHIAVEPYCQCCGRHKKLEVHHIIPWHKSPELRVEPSNLITLCRECHFRFGHHSYWKDSNPLIKLDCQKFDQVEIVRKKRKWPLERANYVEIQE